LIAKGGVEPPGGMAWREVIVQLLGRRRQACHEPVAAAAVHGGGSEQQLAHEGVLLLGKALRCLG
jgi:hypothetical protein